MGVIYILTNPSFTEYVKLGYANDLNQRHKQLNSSTAVPFAFRPYAVYETEEKLTDLELHKLIDKLNPDLRAIETINGKKRTKEFYMMSKEDAYSILESIAKISGTTEKLKKLAPTSEEKKDAKIAEENRREGKRSPFKFSMCGIKPSEKITYCRNKKITAEVLDDTKILYNNEVMSLTALALMLLGNPKSHVAGTHFFEYNGKLLSDLRIEGEKNGD